QCLKHDVCGDWADYAVSVAAAGGDSKQLVAGETETIGDYLVASASSQQLPNQAGNSCADWYVSASELLLIHKSPLGAANVDCEPNVTSSLPGVDIQFGSSVRCQYTLAEAAAGIKITYQVVVADDVLGVSSSAQDIGGCMVPAAG